MKYSHQRIDVIMSFFTAIWPPGLKDPVNNSDYQAAKLKI